MAHELGRMGLVGALLLLLCAPAAGAPSLGTPEQEPGAAAVELDALWPLRDEPAAARAFERRLEQALDEAPDDPELLWRAARWRVWCSQGAAPHALRSTEAHGAWLIAERALRLAPDSLPVRYWAALSAGAWGQTMGIVAALRQGIEGKFRENLEYVLRRDRNYDGGGLFEPRGERSCLRVHCRCSFTVALPRRWSSAHHVALRTTSVW
jgi:hypothetical protein